MQDFSHKKPISIMQHVIFDASLSSLKQKVRSHRTFVSFIAENDGSRDVKQIPILCETPSPSNDMLHIPYIWYTYTYLSDTIVEWEPFCDVVVCHEQVMRRDEPFPFGFFRQVCIAAATKTKHSLSKAMTFCCIKDIQIQGFHRLPLVTSETLHLKKSKFL